MNHVLWLTHQLQILIRLFLTLNLSPVKLYECGFMAASLKYWIERIGQKIQKIHSNKTAAIKSNSGSIWNYSKLQHHDLCAIHNLHKTSTAVHVETHPSQSLNIFPPNWAISVWVEQQSKAWLAWSSLALVEFGITGTSLEMGDWPWALQTSLTGLESAAPVFTLVFLLEGHI